MEVVIWDILIWASRRPSVVSEMEHSRFDTQPISCMSTHALAPQQEAAISIPSQVPCNGDRYVSNRTHQRAHHMAVQITEANVFPLAGNPTVMMAILPEWKSRPDSVLYSWAGASSTRSGRSCIASTNVLDLRRNRGDAAATSAVLRVIWYQPPGMCMRGTAFVWDIRARERNRIRR